VVPAPGAAVSGGQLLAQPGQESEYDWLKKAYAQEVLALDKLIESILETSASLLKTCACQISVEITPRLSPVIGQPVTLRQAFLTILLAAVRAGSRGDIRISARPTGKDIVVEISTLLQEKPEGVPSQASDVAEYIEQARRLIELSSGTLMLVPIGSQHRFAASVTLHCAEEINILVIDDNEDSLLLFKRYLEGTHFQFNGTRDPQQALTMAAETQPRVIILDIMLPGIDGWELLSRLRNHPRLEKVPIIISTILPYEQLAASLGASGFIRKPVSREQLLDLLNKQVESAP
jgi:CheY-like chemotaxis protein